MAGRPVGDPAGVPPTALASSPLSASRCPTAEPSDWFARAGKVVISRAGHPDRRLPRVLASHRGGAGRGTARRLDADLSYAEALSAATGVTGSRGPLAAAGARLERSNGE